MGSLQTAFILWSEVASQTCHLCPGKTAFYKGARELERVFLFSAWSICCTTMQNAGQQKIQQSGFEWRKGSDVDVWLHLFSLHAAVVMFIREYEPAQQMLLSWRER